MKTTTILVDRVGYEKEITKIRNVWLNDLLIFLGIDEEFLYSADKGEIVDLLFDNSIDVMFYADIGALSVSFNGELVGEWAGPELTMKEDESGLLYFEANIANWSIIEEE
tara:strand:- start:3973 stop:4302 length:330 start_codon:yes stop_codon:yes gene_type:complete